MYILLGLLLFLCEVFSNILPYILQFHERSDIYENLLDNLWYLWESFVEYKLSMYLIDKLLKKISDFYYDIAMFVEIKFIGTGFAGFRNILQFSIQLYTTSLWFSNEL